MIENRPQHVLEIGCGDGRLTWRLAEIVNHITAIDPNKDDIEKARTGLLDRFKHRVEFVEATLEEFCESIHTPRYDLAVFSWAL